MPTIARRTDPAFGTLKQVEAGVLKVGYVEAGPAKAPSFCCSRPSRSMRSHCWTRSRSGRQSSAAATGGAHRQHHGRAPAGALQRQGVGERRLAAAPSIKVPTITLEGDANGAPYPDPSACAGEFVGKYEHRLVKGDIGHNLPQEAPAAFAKAIIDLDRNI